MSKNTPHCNRSFVVESLLQNKRVDGRSLHDFRPLQVNYGQTYGSCYVQLGHTVVFASTEATIDEPRLTRPSEGRFRVAMNICAGGKDGWLRNIERSQPKEAVLVMRLLEKIINRINVIDLESLCLITGQAVWNVCTKIVLLNYDGNLIEAASIATIASLMHFRRPEASVTSEGRVVVHSLEEKNPIPLTLFHYPICVTFQFMDHTVLSRLVSENQELSAAQHQRRVAKAQQLMICDPTEEEEEFLSNVLVICANTYTEIVAIQSLGRLPLSAFSNQQTKLVNGCTEIAFQRVKFVTDYLRQELHKHNQATGLKRFDFHQALKAEDLWLAKKMNLLIATKLTNNESFEEGEIDEAQIVDFLHKARNRSDQVGQGGTSSWNVSYNDAEFDEEEEFKEPEDQESSQIETEPQAPEAMNPWTYGNVARVAHVREETVPKPSKAKAQWTPTIVPKPIENATVSNAQTKAPNKQGWVKVNTHPNKQQQQQQPGGKKNKKKKNKNKNSQPLDPMAEKAQKALELWDSDEEEGQQILSSEFASNK